MANVSLPDVRRDEDEHDSSVKLWHDDVRPAPEGWVWARTNEEAKTILERGNVVIASLDHDMGNHDLPPGTGDFSPASGMPHKPGHETGYDLVEWMIQKNHVPPRVHVHAWNPRGSDMAARLRHECPECNVTREAYRVGMVPA